MAIRLPRITHAKQLIRRSSNGENRNIPKGSFAVYVGECEKKRFVVPISFLIHPVFQVLLNKAEEEFRFYHPMCALTIPCSEELFIDLTSQLSGL